VEHELVPLQLLAYVASALCPLLAVYLRVCTDASHPARIYLAERLIELLEDLMESLDLSQIPHQGVFIAVSPFAEWMWLVFLHHLVVFVGFLEAASLWFAKMLIAKLISIFSLVLLKTLVRK